LVIVQFIRPYSGVPRLHTRLMHASGQWLQSIVPLYSIQKGPQIFGAEVTYQKRYSYGALLNVSAEEDDDDGIVAQDAQGTARIAQPPRPIAKPPTAAQPSAGNAFANRGTVKVEKPAPASKSADPWLEGALMALNDEAPGNPWIVLLKKISAQCTTLGQVSALRGSDAVKNILAATTTPEAVKRDIEKAFNDASARLADEIHRSTPADAEAAHAG
jgi:hypothetical protein